MQEIIVEIMQHYKKLLQFAVEPQDVVVLLIVHGMLLEVMIW